MLITNKINNFFFILVILLPVFQILGPALPDIVISVFAIYYLFFFLIFEENKLIIIFKEKWLILALLFCSGSIISSFFSYDYTYQALMSSIPYSRFIFFAFFLNIYFLNDLKKLKLLFIVITITIFFVSFDICVQYFFGFDIFGFPATQERNSGPFGEELKGGSFISKYFILTLSFLIFTSINKIFYKVFIFFFCLLCFFGILFSGERAALILFVLSFFSFNFFVFFNQLKEHKFFLIFLPIFILLFFQFLLTDKLKDRYFITTLNDISSFQNILDSHYGAHYITAYNIFLNNPLKGIGQNNFRNLCNDNQYSNLNSKRINDRCSTHPHNYYIQILSDLGLINFIFFLFMIYYIFKNIKKNQNSTIMYFGKILCLIVIFFPFLPTGSFYNNWVSSLNWFLIAICFSNHPDIQSGTFTLKNKKDKI